MKRSERLGVAPMDRVADCPALQLVPGDISPATDHVPLAHCWKEVPPIQFHMPGVVQGPLKAPPEPVLPVAGAAVASAGGAGAWTGVSAGGDAGGVLSFPDGVGAAEVAGV
jgi:hypothetical protein